MKDNINFLRLKCNSIDFFFEFFRLLMIYIFNLGLWLSNVCIWLLWNGEFGYARLIILLKSRDKGEFILKVYKYENKDEDE